MRGSVMVGWAYQGGRVCWFPASVQMTICTRFYKNFRNFPFLVPHLSGSNGREFMFLLKGHEDLRQDERVMQLFGLVNTLLTNDPETFKRHLRLG